MDFNDKPLKIFFSYYKPHIKYFILDMICAVIIAAIDVAFPMVTRYSLDALIPDYRFRTFAIVIAVMFAGYILRRVCLWFVNYWGHVFGIRVECDMRQDVFNHLQKQSYSFYDTHLTGRLMSRATTDLFDITELSHHGPEDCLIAFLTLIGSFVFLLYIRWELAIVVLITLPIIILIAILSRKNLYNTSRKVKDITSEMNGHLESSISGIRVTQGFTNEELEMDQFAKSNKRFSEVREWRFKAMATFMANIEFCNNILSIVVLASGGFLIMQGKMTISDLVAANLFVASFTAPIRKLTNFMEQFTTGAAGFNRFLELMRTDTQIKEAENAIELQSVGGNITFKDVDFAYTKDYPVLQKVSFSVQQGQKFALVGASGGGKTSICNLIPRFYEINGGQILLDGKDIRNIKLKSLRSNIGIVQQDVFLFAGTVRENIAYGNPNATVEEIMEAAKRAEIHEDILKMPKGYDTLVGERGIKLSGGQKQRVSIARCFLKNPPILILDEATSALDTATEIKIQHAFDELSKGRTTIVIAHRLSTIQNADCIAVVNDKNITEIGTHQQLMELRGEYFRLRQNQFSI